MGDQGFRGDDREFDKLIQQSSLGTSHARRLIRESENEIGLKGQQRRIDQIHKEEAMDPNATLAELRELVADPTPADAGLWGIRLERMSELVEALDGWLCKGGFLPDAWCNGGPRL
jgi:hypothetical protein